MAYGSRRISRWLHAWGTPDNDNIYKHTNLYNTKIEKNESEALYGCLGDRGEGNTKQKCGRDRIITKVADHWAKNWKRISTDYAISTQMVTTHCMESFLFLFTSNMLYQYNSQLINEFAISSRYPEFLWITCVKKVLHLKNTNKISYI